MQIKVAIRFQFAESRIHVPFRFFSRMARSTYDQSATILWKFRHFEESKDTFMSINPANPKQTRPTCATWYLMFAFVASATPNERFESKFLGCKRSQGHRKVHLRRSCSTVEVCVLSASQRCASSIRHTEVKDKKIKCKRLRQLQVFRCLNFTWNRIAETVKWSRMHVALCVCCATGSF